jgi:hypothetical protein
MAGLMLTWARLPHEVSKSCMISTGMHCLASSELTAKRIWSGATDGVCWCVQGIAKWPVDAPE